MGHYCSLQQFYNLLHSLFMLIWQPQLTQIQKKHTIQMLLVLEIKFLKTFSLALIGSRLLRLFVTMKLFSPPGD